jgi:hypothetical protein
MGLQLIEIDPRELHVPPSCMSGADPFKLQRNSPMISPVRKEILRRLVPLSESTPDVRFGQLIANLSYLAVGPKAEAVWEMEDEQLLDAIRQHIEDFSERHTEVV